MFGFKTNNKSNILSNSSLEKIVLNDHLKRVKYARNVAVISTPLFVSILYQALFEDGIPESSLSAIIPILSIVSMIACYNYRWHYFGTNKLSKKPCCTSLLNDLRDEVDKFSSIQEFEKEIFSKDVVWLTKNTIMTQNWLVNIYDLDVMLEQPVLYIHGQFTLLREGKSFRIYRDEDKKKVVFTITQVKDFNESEIWDALKKGPATITYYDDTTGFIRT